MSEWYQPIVDGFAGLNSFFGYLAPVLLPLAFLLFVGATAIFVARAISSVVS